MRNPIAWLLALNLLLSPTAVQAAIAYPLSEGMSSASVTELQQTLAWEGYFTVEPTGYFGSITRAALIQWQRDHNLNSSGSFGAAESALLAQSILLREGMSSASVSALQNALRNQGYFHEESTGYFGPITKASLEQWQRSNGLPITGTLSRDEWHRLNLDATEASVATNASLAAISYTNEEIQLLARLIEAEASGENYLGKVAVAAVVINRVKSSQFPNTISGVIYERYQFEPVGNGRINSITASADSLKAAKAGLEGEDPTSGALFFHNPKKSTSAWMHARPVQVQIGDHVFS